MLKILKAPRANCVVDATKLKTKLHEYGYEIKDKREALEEVFQIMAKKGL
jgi:N-acetyl-anhydromuramyl-L-alanine amidase AmpD